MNTEEKMKEYDKDVAYYRRVRALFWMITIPVIVVDFFWPSENPGIWRTFFSYLIFVSLVHYIGASFYFARKHLLK